ncbi:transferase [Lithospermum erythrorhizon]|uniref:Transferase n=1 Tax=Lithospermum erythrorhizon TaxID=34254 RepID=A0AAV3PWC9_LITER
MRNTAWQLGMKGIQILPVPRHRAQLRKPSWIIVLVCLITIFLICAYVYTPKNSSACHVFSSGGCKALTSWLPPSPERELTDEEMASHVVIREVISAPLVTRRSPKVAFLFLTPGALPFEMLWDKFFQETGNNVIDRVDKRKNDLLQLHCSVYHEQEGRFFAIIMAKQH